MLCLLKEITYFFDLIFFNVETGSSCVDPWKLLTNYCPLCCLDVNRKEKIYILLSEKNPKRQWQMVEKVSFHLQIPSLGLFTPQICMGTGLVFEEEPS